MIEDRGRKVEAKILTHGALGLSRKQKEEGNNTTTTAAREMAKGKALKWKEKANVKRAVATDVESGVT